MGIGATILMLVLFPLNSLLFLQEGFAHEKLVQANELKNEKNVSDFAPEPEVQSKKQETILKAQAVDNPLYQPIRKADVKDLVVPGAHASVIIDADTGTIMHYNNGRNQRQIASLTKIMTAVLVMERVKNLEEIVTIDEDAVYAEGTKVGCPRSGYCISQRLKIGEKISVKSLLQAMLMNSANDSAIALAKHIGGSEEAFAKMMTEKAKDLGLVDTNFCTSSGLDIDGQESSCYSSAYDIARIAAYSLRYDTIWKISRLPSNSTVSSADGKIVHTLLNTDQLLDEMPNIIGAKTGFTPLAGYSLLLVANDPSTKHKVVAVVLDDPHRWQDVKTMSSWAFDSYTWK